MWDIIKEKLPRNQVVGLQQIYSLVERHIKLTPDDWLPSAKKTVDTRWKRNIRNILQYRKTTSEIIWVGEGKYILPSSSDPIDLNTSISKTRMSKENFDKLQEIRRQIGEQGEKFVYDREIRNLIAAGRNDLAQKVDWVSLRDVGAGYDIESFNINGERKYIEVKTSVSSNDIFEWSAHEIEVARLLSDQYWLYLVQDIGYVPIIKEIRNPADKIGKQITLTPHSYIAKYND